MSEKKFIKGTFAQVQSLGFARAAFRSVVKSREREIAQDQMKGWSQALAFKPRICEHCSGTIDANEWYYFKRHETKTSINFECICDECLLSEQGY